MKKIFVLGFFLGLFLAMSSVVDASEPKEKIGKVIGQIFSTLAGQEQGAGPNENRQIETDTPPSLNPLAARRPADALSLQTYFPLNHNDVKYYGGTILGTYYSSTYRYSQVNFYGIPCYVEEDSIDGSKAYYGFSEGNLYLYGASLNNESYLLDTPLKVLNESILNNGGALQSSTTLTIDGYPVTLAMNVGVSLSGSVTLPLGKAENCRTVDLNFTYSIPGETDSLEIKEAWVLAADIGKLKIAAYDQFMVRRGWLSLTGGTVGGKSVSEILNPLTANFQANVLSGTAPLTVQFTDLSSGTISNWLWNFGDGTTSTVKNPSHIYSTPGTYSVALAISGSGKSDTETKANYISVGYPAPVAGLSGSPLSGTAPLSVNFQDQSTGAITNWAWDFGDGITSTAQSPIHVYNTPGTYSVSLGVSGPGGSNSITINNYMTVDYAAPVADFTANRRTGLAPLTVDFVEQCEGAVNGYSWNFGDGSADSTSRNPAHVYAVPGSYTVSLTASGPGGNHTATKTHYIMAAKAGADVNNDGEIGLIDAILILRLLAGLDTQFTGPPKDINGDGKIGLAETIYILNVLSH